MKKIYATLALFLTLYLPLTLTLSAPFVSRVEGAEQSPWEENIADNEKFAYESHPIQLSEDNTIRATFLLDYRWFTFRLVYNKTTETYSVYSLGELIVGQSSLKDEGELVAENMQGPAISSDGKYDPGQIHIWFEIKTIDNVTIVYYDGVEVLTIILENQSLEAVKVLSPENKTYNTPDVLLEYKVNQIFYTATYSLDGQENQTITGNTVLTGLTEGVHSIVVYIEVTPEDVAASRTIYFTVSSTNDEEISTPQTKINVKTDETATSTKNEIPDYSTDEPKTTDAKKANEDNSNEIYSIIQQDTNIPNTNTIVSKRIMPSGFLTANIGTSSLSLTCTLIGVLGTIASCFLTSIPHVNQMQANISANNSSVAANLFVHLEKRKHREKS